MKNKNITFTILVTMLLSVVFFLPKITNAEIIVYPLDSHTCGSTASLSHDYQYQSFIIDQENVIVTEFILFTQDTGDSFDFCISETAPWLGDNDTNCLEDHIYTGIVNYGSNHPLKIDIDNWRPTASTTYYYKTFNSEPTNISFSGESSCNFYNDGNMWYTNTPLVGGDLMFLINGYIECEECEECEESSTTETDFDLCAIPDNTVIQRIVGCENIYKTSSTTPDEIKTFYYDIPFFLIIFTAILGALPFLIIVLYLIMKKKK